MKNNDEWMDGAISIVTEIRNYILIIVIAVLGVFALNWLLKPSSTNDIYLIPAGFEGDIQVNYNVPNAPKLEKEGKYDVIPIKADGTYNTSKSDMEYGLVTDKYFYVDKEGHRTPIDNNCIRVGGNGSTGIGTNSIRHNNLSITQTKCSEDFRHWGN